MAQVTPQKVGPWWLEPETFLLLALVLGIYFVRCQDLSIRGEESRWAQVAREMIATGDWITPRQQGEPFLSRPPLGSWLIALATLARGECDVLAVRLPSLFAVLLTTLLIYGYSRQFLSRLGALGAAAGFASMFQVLQVCRSGETEAIFILLLSASLLVWHWAYLRDWPVTAMWLAGYTLTALATLAKGPQAPVYFVASTWLFLIFMRDWRRLFSLGNLAGGLAFLLILAAWAVPFYLDGGSLRSIFVTDTSIRFRNVTWIGTILHLLRYPIEILVSTLPWSLLLLGYLSRRLRRSIRATGSSVPFLVICLAVTFPSCWITPGAVPRYFMPLYPCLAPLLGLVIQRCAESEVSNRLRLAWHGYLAAWALAMIVILGSVIAVTWVVHHPLAESWAQPAGFAIVYAVAAGGLAGLMLRSRREGEQWSRVAVLSLAIFWGMTFTGVVVNGLRRKSQDATGDVARLKAQIPPGEQLVSFLPTHHLFAYHWGEPIRPVPCPTTANVDFTYFCYWTVRSQETRLPFPAEELAVISMQRNLPALPSDEVVVVGRRLRPEEAARKTAPVATKIHESPSE